MKNTLQKLRMVSLLSLTLLGALLTTSSVSAQSAQAVAPTTTQKVSTVDRIVAVVNKQAITQRELDARIASTITTMTAQNVPIPQHQALQQQVLEQMIIEQTQLQEAKDLGIRVDDFQLERTIQLIAQQNKLTVPELREKIQAQGLTFDQYREDLRMDIILSRLRERAVESSITVTEHDIDDYLKLRGPNVDSAPPLVTLAQILVHVPEGSSPVQVAALRERADNLYRQASGPVDFARLAANSSDGPEALQGGTLGTRPADRWPDLFNQALQGLAVGQISPVIQSGNGFHILKLVDVQKQSPQSNREAIIARQTHARHILIRPSEILTMDQALEKIKGIRERIVEGKVPFADMAKQYSNDSNAPQGGDMGWVTEGQMVPQFEKAMDDLAIGKVSDPVETPYGWHLILVEERRNHDVSGEIQRIEARRVIHDEKLQTAFEDWARQLRDRAYVENRLNDDGY